MNGTLMDVSPAPMQGVIHLTDKQGVCRPPLAQPGEEDGADPFVLAFRRGLAVVAGERRGRVQGVSVSQVGVQHTLRSPVLLDLWLAWRHCVPRHCTRGVDL